MKRIMVFAGIAVLFVLAGAGFMQKNANSAPEPNSGPNWFSVEATDLRLWVAESGLYGGWYQNDDHGLLFHISTPRNPDYHGPQYGLHSNPTNDGGFYGNDWDHWAAMPEGVTIPAGSTASVAFWAHWSLEEDADGVKLEIATSQDNYTVWTCLQPTGSEPCAPWQCEGTGWCYDGNVGGYGDWSQYSCDLTSYNGKTIKLRFRIITDDSQVYTGFLVDDVAIIANGFPIANYGFELLNPNLMWVTDAYWGRTVQSLWTDTVMFQGEVIAGLSTSYVADYFDFDWQAFGAWLGPPLHLRQTTRWTAPTGQPKFDLDTYFYAPSGTGAGKYIIADCYLKNIEGSTINNLYLACHMEPTIELGFDDQANYYSAEKMLWVCDYGQLDQDCVGIMYLAPGSPNPRAAVISNIPNWGNDSWLYTNMSTQQYSGQTAAGKWYTLLSAGPYNSASFQPQLLCGVVRFTFAFVCGNSSTDLDNNATSCRIWYNANLANNPQIPNKVAPTSLGNIKALYNR